MTKINSEDSTKRLENSATELNRDKKKKTEQKKKNKVSIEASSSEIAPKPIIEQKGENKPVQPSSSNDSPKQTPKLKPMPKPKTQPTKTSQASKPQLKFVVQKKILMNKLQTKQKDPLKKVVHKIIDKKGKKNKNNPKHTKGLSDERLKAFGINPKKFIKQQKYASNTQPKQLSDANKTSPKKLAPNLKHTNKLKNKLKKVLKS